MRLTTNRPRIGALLFLPLLLALGCARAPEAAAPVRTPDPAKTVLVNITLDASLTPKPDRDPVQLSKKAEHRALWKYCGKGRMDMTMKDDGNNPFESVWERWVDPADGCQYILSPKIKDKAKEKKGYLYTISVWIDNGYHPNDPDIEIMK
jgi:hypothetical protein